jgi:hypothetical protein
MDLFYPLDQYKRLINRDPRLINRRSITIRAPQWLLVGESHNIERSGMKEL